MPPIQRVNVAFSAFVLVAGLAIAVSTLTRGIWLDEFWEYTLTARGTSLPQFLADMSLEQHTFLHYGIIYLAQTLGLTDISELRALNILGVFVVIAALGIAARRRAITPSGACIIVALYASSPIFLDYFADLTPYFLVFSASIAVSLAWLVVVHSADAARGNAQSGLMFYGICLAIFVNLHYFATLFGGLLTLALLIEAASHRRWSKAITIACIGLLAAAPAIALGAVQAPANLVPGKNWITTAAADGLAIALDVIQRAIANNYVSMACAAVALLWLVQGWRSRREVREIALLATTTIGFFGLVIGANAIYPIMVDRYLFAGAGSIILLGAMLCVRPAIPAISIAAICLCALIMQTNSFLSRQYYREGWRTSAQFAAQQVGRCPTTQIFAAPLVDHTRDESLARIWRSGYRYYAREFNFQFQEVHRGDTVTASGGCPTLVWLEHVWKVQGLPVDRLLSELRVTAIGRAEVSYIGSGAVITVQ